MEPTIETLIHDLHSTDITRRKRASDQLAALGEAALPALCRLLADSDPGLRRTAAALLGKVGGSAVIAPLLNALHDPQPSVRADVVRQLATLADPTITRALQPLLHDPADGVRAACLRAITQREGVAALPILLEATHDPAYAVRVAAATALGKLGDGRALDAVLECLEDQVWEVRGAAAMACGQLGDGRAIRPLLHALTPNPPLPKAALQTPNQYGIVYSPAHDFALIVTRVLGQIGHLDLGALVEALHHNSPLVRLTIIDALGAIADPRAIPHLVSAIHTNGWGLQRRAAHALGRIGEAAIPALIELISMDDTHLQTAAVHALRKIGTPAALDTVAAWEQRRGM